MSHSSEKSKLQTNNFLKTQFSSYSIDGIKVKGIEMHRWLGMERTHRSDVK